MQMDMYQELLDDAMLGIVKKVLSRVQINGLDSEQSFYISFFTNHPDVIISKRVQAQYPDEITIILQYQYRDLQVFDDCFNVNIAFGGVAETIQVPFEAITSFIDPGAKFSLQFKRINDEDYGDEFDDNMIDEVVDSIEQEMYDEFEKYKKFRAQESSKNSNLSLGRSIPFHKPVIKDINSARKKLDTQKTDTKKVDTQKVSMQKAKSQKMPTKQKENSSSQKNLQEASQEQRKPGKVISIDQFIKKKK